MAVALAAVDGASGVSPALLSCISSSRGCVVPLDGRYPISSPQRRNSAAMLIWSCELWRAFRGPGAGGRPAGAPRMWRNRDATFIPAKGRSRPPERCPHDESMTRAKRWLIVGKGFVEKSRQKCGTTQVPESSGGLGHWFSYPPPPTAPQPAVRRSERHPPSSTRCSASTGCAEDLPAICITCGQS